MPGIFNVGNAYNINNKRITSKMTFDTGEKFSGKLVKKEGKEAVIRLVDGWEFEAEIDGDIDSLSKGFHRFEVDGFEGGKLKLKIVAKNIDVEDLSPGDFENIITKEGLSKENIDLLRSMVKFNIPLTKENIKEIQALGQFLDKIKLNEGEIDEFISKYLETKGISPESTEGNKIINELKEFLNAFKTLSKEDLLLIFENNIDITKENITAYNNLFKGDKSILKILNNIQGDVASLKEALVNNMGLSMEEVNELLLQASSDLQGDYKSTQVANDNNSIGKNVDIKEKGITLDNNIKEPSEGSELVNKTSKENAGDGSIINKALNTLYQKSETQNSKVSLLSILKSISGQTEDYLNLSLKDILLNRRSSFTSAEFDRLSNLINSLEPEEFINSLKSVIAEYNEIGENNLIDDFNSYINKSNNEALGITNSLEFTKGEAETLLSNLMGKGITLTEEEFSKLQDGINLKYQEIVEKEESLKNQLNNSNIDSKDIKTIGSENAEESIKNLSNVKSEISELNSKLLSKDMVKASIQNTGETGKEIIKDILNSLKGENILSEKLIEVIKNNINEIKLFNKLSLEYYYADIPVKIRENEYPCKLIVKDKRKDSKKIDSTNIKMVITIDTKNLGIVDGYMKVLDKKIDIDLKCEDKFVKIIDITKNKLISNIEAMGFLVDVRVSKKEEEVSLTTCRDFFNPDSGISLDRMV